MRFSDPITRIVLIRVPREFADRIRASLVFIRNLDATLAANSIAYQQRQQQESNRIVVSIISVHGSSRTARLASMEFVRKCYRKIIIDRMQNQNQDDRINANATAKTKTINNKHKKDIDRLCKSMEETLLQIQSLHY